MTQITKTKNLIFKITIMNTNLKNAVLTQIGVSKKEFKKNVSDYRDASAGISGFIYYSDTHEFSMANQSDIVELLEEQAEESGQEVVEMVKNFGIFKGSMDRDELKDLYNYLGGNKKIEQGAVTNIMAWFAVESLAFEYDR